MHQVHCSSWHGADEGKADTAKVGEGIFHAYCSYSLIPHNKRVSTLSADTALSWTPRNKTRAEPLLLSLKADCFGQPPMLKASPTNNPRASLLGPATQSLFMFLNNNTASYSSEWTIQYTKHTEEKKRVGIIKSIKKHLLFPKSLDFFEHQPWKTA